MPDSLTITREWFAMLEALPTVQSRWNVLYAVSRFAFDGVKPEGLNPIEKSIFMNMKQAIQNRLRVARCISNKPKASLESALESNVSTVEGKALDSALESALESNGGDDLFNIKEINGNLKKDNTMDTFKDLKENTIKESQKKSRKVFVPPTLEDVRDYAYQRNSPIDPEEFFSYYSANGWMVGKNKMKDWKKAFVYWERSFFNRERRKHSPPPRDYSGI